MKKSAPAPPPVSDTPAPSPGHRTALMLILAVAAGLRLWYINWGLPELYEEATPLVQAWKIWMFGQPGIDFNPHFFNYPALTIYLNFVLQAMQYGIGHLAGAYASLDQFGGTVESHVVPARLLAVAFDLGTVWLTFLLGRRLTTGTIGLIAAALVAVNPLHIAQAHYITVDIPLTFFTVLSLLWIVRAAGSGKLRDHLLAGVAIGLASASKYTGAFIIVAYAVAVASARLSWRDGIRDLVSRPFIAGLAASAVVFLACNPYIVLSFDEFYQDFSFEQYHVTTGHLGVDTSQATIDYYLFQVLVPAIGVVMFILCLAALAKVILRREKRYAALAVFSVVYIAIISSWEMRADRYLLPAIAPLLLLGVAGAVALWNDLRGTPALLKLAGSGRSVTRVVVAAAALAVFAPVIYRTAAFEQSLTMPDTRALAKAWVLQNLAPGGMIVTGSFGVEFPEGTYKVLHIPFLVLEAERVAPFYDTRWYTDFDLLIASSFDHDRYAANPKQYADFLPFYDSLRSGWKLAGEVTPKPDQSGPAFWFYEPTDAVRSRTFAPTLFEKLHGAIESARISTFLNNLSFVVQQKGQNEKAEQVLREILSVEVENLRARNSLALVLDREGKLDQALLEAQRSLRQNISQPDMFAFAGTIFLKKGMTREAELSFYKAISLDNTYIPAHKDLIDLYRQTNDRKNLLNALMRYRSLLPPGDETAQQLSEEIARLQAGR